MHKYVHEIKIDKSLSLVIPNLNCAPEIFSLIDKDREHLRTWLPWVDSTLTVDDTVKNLVERIETFQTLQQTAFYGTLDGNFVASVGFVILNDGEGEIGYWLLSNYGGKGLMTTYVKACIDFGFRALSLQRIIIKCAEGNIKSAAIPKRLGFTLSNQTGKECVRNGEERRTLIFTLDKSDWLND